MTTSPSLIQSESYVPYARRRNTPAQVDALSKLFEAAPHPTRAQRQALANEIGMELKSVTNWFQNRRQTSRKKFLPSNENNHTNPHSPTRHRQGRSKTSLDRSKISLDRIAALSERPGLTLQSEVTRSPLTPRGNVRRKRPSSPAELWTHMLSSPVVPPSSPRPEEARLAVLSSGARGLFPLEWACLKARQRKWADEDADGFTTHPAMRRCRDIDGGGTEPEAITLESVSPRGDASSNNLDFSRTPQFEDVEAAITLLGFKAHS